MSIEGLKNLINYHNKRLGKVIFDKLIESEPQSSEDNPRMKERVVRGMKQRLREQKRPRQRLNEK